MGCAEGREPHCTQQTSFRKERDEKTTFVSPSCFALNAVGRLWGINRMIHASPEEPEWLRTASTLQMLVSTSTHLDNIYADVENARLLQLNNVQGSDLDLHTSPDVFRDLVSGVAVWGKPGDHPLQQSWPRLQKATPIHLPRRQRDRVCKVKDADGLPF